MSLFWPDLAQRGLGRRPLPGHELVLGKSVADVQALSASTVLVTGCGLLAL